jgi:hypothetical protein
MPNKIERVSVVTSAVTATNSASTSPKTNYGSHAGGIFIVDSVAGGATSLTWHVAFGPEVTAVPVNDGTADVSTTIVASKAYPIPDALFAAPFIVAVTNAGTATFRLCVKG